MTNLFKGPANMKYSGATISAVAFGAIIILSSKQIPWNTTNKVLVGVAVAGLLVTGMGTLNIGTPVPSTSTPTSVNPAQ